MLNNFFAKFKLDEGFPLLDDCNHIKGEKELIKHMEGRSWERGLYRTLKADSQREWRDLVGLAFKGYERTVVPFGCDWLGRLYCLDSQREHQNQHLILMFDPASFAVYQIPANLLGFYNALLSENDRDFLNLGAFLVKITEVNNHLLYDDCFGYRLPEFLGGKFSVENLELVNVKFYWELTIQIHNGVADLPDSKKIDSVKVK